MEYLDLNGEWYVKNKHRRLYADESSPVMLFLTLPDRDFVRETGIVDLEDLPHHRVLEINICFQ